MDGRRTLDFERLDQVMPEVDRLLGGHATSGAWTLGQVLHHLATALRLTLENDSGLMPDHNGPELERLHKVRRRQFFRAGRFPEGATAPHPLMDPPLDADERTWAESLRSLLRLFEEFEGTFPPHPILGPMSKDEWSTFHRLHCAHHLGFARPITNHPSHSGSDITNT